MISTLQIVFIAYQICRYAAGASPLPTCLRGLVATRLLLDEKVKKAPLSLSSRDKGANYLCGTTLIPFFNGTRFCCIGQTRRSLLLTVSVRGSGVIWILLYRCLSPNGSSLRVGRRRHVSPSKRFCMEFICGWDRNSGRTACPGRGNDWWWLPRQDAWALPWGKHPRWCPPKLPGWRQSHLP